MSSSQRDTATEPYAVLGAGALTSHLHRSGDELSVWKYQFNLFRQNEPDCLASCCLRPEDLHDVVKLCQVLAFTIADDGWIPEDLCEELLALATELDTITQRAEDTQR